MKFSEAKVDQTVVDVQYPYKRGWITQVLKTRLKVRFLGEPSDTTYDKAHTQFLTVTGTRRIVSSAQRRA